MEKLQKKRSEINDNYKWDLTLIYKSDEQWYKDLKNVSNNIIKIKNYEGKIVKCADNLLEYLEFSLNIERKLYKLYYYAHLKHDQDTTDTDYQVMKGKIDNLITEYDELNSYANPEMMTVSYETIKCFYEENKKLKEYEFLLENIYRYKNHILSNELEQVLSSLTNVLSGGADIYTSLVDSDMKFGFIKDENGEEIELTESNFRLFLQSNNREVRKNAFEKLFNTYGSFKNTISQTFANNVDMLTKVAKLKNFNSSLESSLFEENIGVEVYNNLIDTVSNNLDVLFKYFDLKKKLLNLDEFHLYDQYVELVPNCSKKYTFDDAKKIVIEALGVLGNDYIDNLNKAFDEKWIDVYNNVGKRGGAYSSGFYDTKPYILLNYEGTINDVSTLAHELGHSMHTYYSCSNNPYHYSSYRIFVAEVASTVNELLLNLYLLNKTSDNDEKKYILNNLMDLFKATIYRQTMFAEFERDVHYRKEQGEVLTYDSLCKEYYELNKKYFGDNVVVDECIKYEWERIPHFYYNFYVYKYAIGLSCACYIVENILEGKEKAVDNYINFLKSGGSDYPIDELKIAGIDVTKKEVVESAIKMFENLIDKFEKIS